MTDSFFEHAAIINPASKTVVIKESVFIQSSF